MKGANTFHPILPVRAKKVVMIKNLFHTMNAAAENLADKVSEWFGKPLSIVLHLIFWIWWIVTRGFTGSDHFPFGELTLILSLEAIFLSMLILNSSTRQVKRDSTKIHQNTQISAEVRDDVKSLHDDIEDILELLEIEPEDNEY